MKKKLFLPWIFWLIAAAYFFFDYVQQVAPSAMGHALLKSFDANAVTIGAIAAAYYYSYAIMQIPVGLLVDRFGPRRPLTIASLIAALMCYLFSISDTPFHAELARFFLGAVTGFSFVSCLKLVSLWFPQRVVGLLTGLTNTVAMIGAITAEAPLTKLVSIYGWRETMVFMSAIYIILAVLIFLIIREHERIETSQSFKTNLQEAWQHLKMVVKNRESWFVGIYAATINTPFAAFAALWGVPYLQKAYGIDADLAATIISMIFFGAIFGSIFWGWFSDLIKKRLLPMFIAASCSAVLLAFILYLHHLPIWLLFTIIFLLGFSASGNILAYAIGIDIRPPHAAGVSLGFVNTWLIAGAAISESIVSSILQLLHPAEHMTTFVYSEVEYTTALSFVLICLIVAVISIFFLKETHCRAKYET